MLFSVPKEKKSFLNFLPCALLFLTLVGFAIFTRHISDSNGEQNYQLLEQALHRSITQCYALEGAYPPSLEYLVNNYGLLYNKEDFFIDYQYIASNLRPDITIIERN